MFIDLANCTPPPAATDVLLPGQRSARTARPLAPDNGTELPDLSLAKRCVRELLAAAWAVFPEECCGVLLGEPADVRRTRILAAAVVENRALGDRTRNFAMAPDAIQQARRAHGAGLDIVGFFHSHPEGQARPSAMDLRHASPWGGYLHGIISISQFRPPEIRLFDAQGQIWRELLRWR